MRERCHSLSFMLQILCLFLWRHLENISALLLRRCFLSAFIILNFSSRQRLHRFYTHLRVLTWTISLKIGVHHFLVFRCSLIAQCSFHVPSHETISCGYCSVAWMGRLRGTPIKNTPKLGLSSPDLWFPVPYVSTVKFTVRYIEVRGNICLSMDKINMFHKALHNALHIYAFQTATRIHESVVVKFEYVWSVSAMIGSTAQVGKCTFCQEFWLNYIDPAFSKINLKFLKEMWVCKKNYDTNQTTVFLVTKWQ